jgi:hypothetical protein
MIARCIYRFKLLGADNARLAVTGAVREVGVHVGWLVTGSVFEDVDSLTVTL